MSGVAEDGCDEGELIGFDRLTQAVVNLTPFPVTRTDHIQGDIL